MKKQNQKVPGTFIQKGAWHLLLCLCLLAPPIFAEAEDYSVGISQKLGRGLWNILSSPAEIPCGIRDEVKERGSVGSVTGIFTGLTLMLRRILVGATEVMTFVIPMEPDLPAVCSKEAPADIQ